MFLRQLRILRRQNKMSQQQVADALEVSRSTYCSYESGRRTPDIEAIVKLSVFYRVPVERFFEDLIKQYAEDEDYYEGQPDTRFLSQITRAEHDQIVNLRLISNDDRVAIMEAAASKVVSKN